MPTPDYIRTLRENIGHQLLYLPGVTAVVLRKTDDDGEPLTHPEVLLVRRADSGEWSVTSGIMEPGEEPAVTAAREVLEETGVVARAVRVVGVSDHGHVRYPNGDECWFADTAFEMEYISGKAVIGDEESTQVGWFRADALPEPFVERHRERIAWALETEAPTRFKS